MTSRRQLLAGFGSAAVVGLSGCLGDEMEFSPGTNANTDWPMPRYDPSNTAYNPDAKAPREGVRERWTYKGGMATGTPAIAGGTVFLSTAEALVALDAASGEKQWRFAPDDGPWFSAPVVHDGLVYVTASGKDAAYAVDANSGEEVWSHADVDIGRAGVHLLAGGHVSEPVLYTGTENGRLLRLDAKSGGVTWRGDLFGTISAFGYHFGQLYVGTYGGEIYAFSDTVDGVEEPGEMWRRKVGSAVEAILTDGDNVLVGTFGGPLRCLQTGAHAGAARWTIDRKWAGSAPVNAGHAFFAAGYEGLSAVGENDGQARWRLDGEFDATGPVAAGDTLYASSGDAVHAFALDGGIGAFGHRFDAERWSHPTPAGVVAGLAVADGALFAACEGSEENDVSLYCLESPS